MARGAWVSVAFPLVLSAQCSNDAVGVDACREIEGARCNFLDACGAQANFVYRARESEPAADACKRYYDDACRHGLVTTKEPSSTDVKACVEAIQTGDCATVKAPESNVACAFLIPPAEEDAGSDAAAGDGGDAASDSAASALSPM